MKLITRINTNEELYSGAHSKLSPSSLARSRIRNWSGFWSSISGNSPKSSSIILNWSHSRSR